MNPGRPGPDETVPDGIIHHARIVSTYGPFAGLGSMALCATLSVLILWHSQSTVRGVIGFVLALGAVPTLPIFGFPLVTGGTKWLIALASSAVVWLVLGTVASRRACQRAVVTWRDWRNEMFRLALGIWVGVFIGFAAAGLFLIFGM